MEINQNQDFQENGVNEMMVSHSQNSEVSPQDFRHRPLQEEIAVESQHSSFYGKSDIVFIPFQVRRSGNQELIRSQPRLEEAQTGHQEYQGFGEDKYQIDIQPFFGQISHHGHQYSHIFQPFPQMYGQMLMPIPGIHRNEVNPHRQNEDNLFQTPTGKALAYPSAPMKQDRHMFRSPEPDPN